MLSLDTQLVLEQLLGKQAVAADQVLPSVACMYFTARWCGACKRLDLDAIEAATPGVTWYKCDVDVNTYSPGFCGVRSIPSFMLIVNKRPIGPMTSSDTGKVVAWVLANSSVAEAGQLGKEGSK
jgi:thioredoxin-like negative regulator of GroEL